MTAKGLSEDLRCSESSATTETKREQRKKPFLFPLVLLYRLHASVVKKISVTSFALSGKTFFSSETLLCVYIYIIYIIWYVYTDDVIFKIPVLYNSIVWWFVVGCSPKEAAPEDRCVNYLFNVLVHHCARPLYTSLVHTKAARRFRR